MTISQHPLLSNLKTAGFAFVPASEFEEWISTTDHARIGTASNSSKLLNGQASNGQVLNGQHAGWSAFADSWNHLSLDTYMADGGRYRRRRFAAFSASSQDIVRKPHQPHYQSRDYNPLNGGIERWFEPIDDAIAEHPIMQACLRLCCDLFSALTKQPPAAWHVEAHQFRIEARRDEQGHPTPEGLHRDGVDWVLVLLIARENVAEGVTTIHDSSKHALGKFTLTVPMDAAFVDDSRVFHGVTAVTPLDSQAPAFRDVLVLTYRRP